MSVSKYSIEPTKDQNNEVDPFKSSPYGVKSKWDDFDRSQKRDFSCNDWDEEDFQDPFGCDVSKVSASTLSYRNSPTISTSKNSSRFDSSSVTPTVSSHRSLPTMSSSNISSRFDSNSATHSTISAYRSLPSKSVSNTLTKFENSSVTQASLSAYRSSPTYSNESQSSSKFRPSPGISRSHSGSQKSNWTDVSPTGVAEFNHTVYEGNKGISRKKLFLPEAIG